MISIMKECKDWVSMCFVLVLYCAVFGGGPCSPLTISQKMLCNYDIFLIRGAEQVPPLQGIGL